MEDLENNGGYEMSVMEINGAANRPIYTPGKAARGVPDNSFSRQMNRAQEGNTLTLHWFDAPEGDKPLGALGDKGNGSITVYKPKDFDPENPVYKVKTWDAEGNVTERKVDVSKVDVKNSDRADMFAYACYLTDSGQYPEAQSTFCRIPISNEQPENLSDAFKAGKFNWLELAKSFMQMQYDAGNIQGYLSYKKFVDFFSESRTIDGENTALEAYQTSASVRVRNVKPAYKTYESANYRIVPDNEAGCFDIYNKQGERLGAFDYSDIKIRQDFATGKQFLISEHGTMGYDALAMDGELKEALQDVLGVEALETEPMQGFTLKTHSGTGIQYLVRDGEEGRGGKVLLQSQTDIEKYEALAETYFNKYSNLIHDKNAAYLWADLEIKGLAQHTEDGIISMGFNEMSYHDNSNDKNNWSVLFSGDTYKAVFDWLQSNRGSIEEMQKFAAWQEVFKNIGSRYERVWSDEEEKQGYLNN